MVRLAVAFTAVALLSACAAEGPPTVAELQCRNFAQRSSAAEFNTYVDNQVGEGLALTRSPMMDEDIQARACD